jgi:hypothetical protein
MTDETVTLWRPVGPKELDLIEQAGMRAFPPRLSDQPIFYPVTTEDYAVRIARDWNVPASGEGFVTRFEVKADYLAEYEIQEVGGRACQEYWIPADQLPSFNSAIVGPIEVVRRFACGPDGQPCEGPVERAVDTPPTTDD